MKPIYSLIPLLVCITHAGWAQQPSSSPTKSSKPTTNCLRRLPKRTAPPITPFVSAPANQPRTDFFVGEARVVISEDETVVKLAMAPHGTVLIELPANDALRHIISGDAELVMVDEKALEKNKRAIVVRPGSLFVAPKSKKPGPAGTVTAQMRSGLVVTFLFYPVTDLTQNVHRCVLSYRLDEVVFRRRAAGLPVNLDNKEQGGDKTTAQSTTALRSTSQITPESSSKTSNASGSRAGDAAAKNSLWATARDPTVSTKTIPPGVRIVGATREALASALAKPEKFKAWSKPVHGIALAAEQLGDLKDEFWLVVVAVRNESAEPLKVTPGNPDLTLEMLDDQGKVIHVQSIKRLYTEVNDLSGIIPAGSTVYYAIAYDSPVIGVHQQLKIAVSRTNAADEPVAITLSR